MGLKWNNLRGWVRDVKSVLRTDTAEADSLRQELFDVLDDVSDSSSDGTGEWEDDDLDADGGEGTGTSSSDVVGVEQSDDAPDARVVRVAGRESDQLHMPLADTGGTGGRPADGPAPVLNTPVTYNGGRRRGQ